MVREITHPTPKPPPQSHPSVAHSLGRALCRNSAELYGRAPRSQFLARSAKCALPGGCEGEPWPQWGRVSPRSGARHGGAMRLVSVPKAARTLALPCPTFVASCRVRACTHHLSPSPIMVREITHPTPKPLTHFHHSAARSLGRALCRNSAELYGRAPPKPVLGTNGKVRPPGGREGAARRRGAP